MRRSGLNELGMHALDPVSRHRSSQGVHAAPRPVGAVPRDHTPQFRAGLAVHPWTQWFYFGFLLLRHLHPARASGAGERSFRQSPGSAARGRWPAILHGESRGRLASDRQSSQYSEAQLILTHLPVATSCPMYPLTLTFLFYFGHGIRRTLISPP